MDKRNFISLFGKSFGLGAGLSTVSSFVPGLGTMVGAYAGELDGELGIIRPHHLAKAKSVIWLHQYGAPSSIDLFDYKPQLAKMSGQKIPDSFIDGLSTSTQGGVGELYSDETRRWKQFGESGAWFSSLIPNIAECADKIAFIKSSVTIGATHDISTLKLNTGDINPGRPSLGAWISYALGTRNLDLPPYILLYNGQSEPSGGSINWGSGFLPATYQGVAFRPGASPIMYIERPELMANRRIDSSLQMLKRLDSTFNKDRNIDPEIEARIKSYELAERMRIAAPEAVDVSKETEATKKLYGLDDAVSNTYGNTLLRARRLVERGVRFVHVVSGAPEGETQEKDWDAHDNIHHNHNLMSRMVDKPIGGLLKDLESRGLLDSTLVVWTAEFGRTPWSESGTGRDHNPWGYTQWFAGGGIKPGASYGETDELGLKVLDPSTAVDTFDVHATVLHLLGLDHKKTLFEHNGRAERPTVVHGRVVNEILA